MSEVCIIINIINICFAFHSLLQFCLFMLFTLSVVFLINLHLLVQGIETVYSLSFYSIKPTR